MALIGRLVALTAEPVVVGLIVHTPPAGAPGSDFEAEARRHGAAERNPFTFWQRARMLRAVLPAVRVIALPRPEAHWELVEAILPGQRSWVVPDCGEDFDDLKAGWFEARGERVLRIRQAPTTDGRRVRALLRAGDPSARAHLPAAVAALAERFVQQEER